MNRELCALGGPGTFPERAVDRAVEQAVWQAVDEMVRPMMESMARCSASMEQMARAVQIMNERLEGLERIQRLSTPLTTAQERQLAAAIRERAAHLQTRYRLAEEARRAYAAALRKMLCRRYGVNAIRAVPSCEYPVALEAIEGWDGTEITEKFI